MSVLIKGMKMPTEGKIMAIYKVKGEFFASLNGTELYPLIELSDHGDLIDREAWKKSLIDEGETIGIDGTYEEDFFCGDGDRKEEDDERGKEDGNESECV